MKTIWKFPLKLSDEQVIVLDPNAKLLHVDRQGDSLTLWAEVETTEKPAPRRLYVVGTGHEVPADAVEHVGSAIVGPFVWHVYDGGPV